jgi:hypothetical protein
MSAHLPGTKNSGSKTLNLFSVASIRGQYQWLEVEIITSSK